MIARLFLSLFLCIAATGVGAQNYPTRALRMIVGFSPGGGTDIVARVIAQKLSEDWGQPVLVENRPGAGGNIASEQVAKAAPDGYTLLMGTLNTHTINQHMYANMPVDPLKDFAPITSVADTPMALVLHPSVKAKTVNDFIALAKANPNEFSVGSAGTGSAGHLCAEMFKAMTGVKFEHVPYKGAGPAINDLLGGQIRVMFAPLAPIAPHVRAGKLNLVAVTTAKRSQMFPEVPTLDESGLPGFDIGSWFGLFAPAGTPEAIVKKIHADVAKHLKDPATRERLAHQALEPVGNSPEEFSAQIRSQSATFAKILATAGVKPQ